MGKIYAFAMNEGQHKELSAILEAALASSTPRSKAQARIMKWLTMLDTMPSISEEALAEISGTQEQAAFYQMLIDKSV